MAKQSGLGDDLYFAGYHIGGDIQDVSMHGGPNLGDVTDITQSAHSRLGLLRDAGIDCTAFFDGAAGQEHAAFSPLSTSDQIITYLRGQALGGPVFCVNAKQVNYDPTRAADGMLTEKVNGQANSFGGEWGIGLTAGLRTDTAPTSPASGVDGLAGTNFGGQAYLQAVALTGTSYTVTIQTAPDNSTWTTLVAFAAVAAVPQAQRVSVSNVTSVQRYVRAITTGTFTVASFQVSFMRNATAGVVF